MTGGDLGGHLDDAAPGCAMFIVFGFLALMFSFIFPDQRYEAPKGEVFWMDQAQDEAHRAERLRMRGSVVE